MKIEQGGREIDFHDLRAALIDVLSLIERDPGVEAASRGPLRHGTASCQRSQRAHRGERRLRLLREARLRYCERLTRARPSAHRGQVCGTMARARLDGDCAPTDALAHRPADP